MSKPNQRRQPDQLEQEARRLANLSAHDRDAALDVHRRIADDESLSQSTREYARRLADTLEAQIARILKKRN